MFCSVELMTLLYFFHKGDLFVLSNRNIVEENDVDIYYCRVMCVHVLFMISYGIYCIIFQVKRKHYHLFQYRS